MEKRFAAFLAIAFAILLANALLTQMLNPQQQEQAAKEGADGNEEKEKAGEKAKDGAKDGQAEKGNIKNDVGKKEDGKGNAPDADALPPAPDPMLTAEQPGASKPDQDTGPQVAARPPPAAPAGPEQIIALGSVDPADGYRMGMILTNRGANVLRLELSDPRYRDIEDHSGYLGHLAAKDAPGGALARVVVPGTPAAQAGLQAGDVITKISREKTGDSTIDSAADLTAALEKTKPHEEIELTFVHGAAPAKTVSVSLTRRPLEVMRPEIENLRMRGAKIPDDFEDPPSFRLTLQQIDEDDKLKKLDSELPGVDLYEGMWRVTSQTSDSVEFRRALPERGLEVIKRFSLKKLDAQTRAPGYDFDLEVEVHNLADEQQKVAVRLDGPTGLPIEGWWYSYKISRQWGGAGLRDLFVYLEGGQPTLISCKSVVKEDTEPLTDKPLLFAGVDAKYFASILIPRKKDLGEEWITEVVPLRIGPESDDKKSTTLTNITCRLIGKPITLQPGGGSLVNRYQVFAGPKQPALLAEYTQPIDDPSSDKTLGELIYYGWQPWAGVARVMSKVLHFFYGFVGNYGLAIVMLTILVRACMFPLSKKQALNMIKMQELQPQMKAIAEKYKNDMEKRAKAQQELIRKNNYNPMGGCLLMFAQLPIFLGLYRSLMVDIELRDAPLVGHFLHWCSNLAAPDMLFYWSSFMPALVVNFLGPYFNLLPVLTVCLFLLQQKMFMPPPADENAALQQKIMKFMMLIMAVLFFRVASGLCVYFIVSSLWGMGERKLLPKPPPKDATASKVESLAKSKPASSNGRSGKQSAKRKKQRRR